jgi:hypothetical protein
METNSGNAGMVLKKLQKQLSSIKLIDVQYLCYLMILTDLTVLENKSIQGYNFVYRRPLYYHTAQDDINHLNKNTPPRNVFNAFVELFFEC